MTKHTTAPRPAATLVLVRDAPQGLEVFMMQRTFKAAFVPGGFVFPGGALDEDDADPFFSDPAFGDREASAALGVERGGLAYFVAAIRECFEESGLLLADEAAPMPVAERTALRNTLSAGDARFSALCRERGWRLRLSQLVYFAHWVTPMGAPRRFDTRFLAAAAPAGQIASHDETETIDHAWIRPADALERHRAGTMDMMFATVRTLETLSRFDDAASFLAHARAMQSIPVHLPRVAATRAGRKVLIQGDHAWAEVGKLDPAGHGKASAELLPGEATRLGERVWRIAAPNPGFMTGPGTNTYLIDTGEGLAVIDPGPAIAEHLARLQRHAEETGSPIRWLLTTHTHMDHSPAARALHERTGAQMIGMPPPDTPSQDRDYRPERTPSDGEELALGAIRLRAVHTPGHASNHLCYLYEEEGMLFTGDHIMQGSTVVINPPDGDMRAYLASLEKIAALDAHYLAPGHGFLIADPPAAVRRLVAHRMAREEKVIGALRRAGQDAALEELVGMVYDDVPPQRHGMAARSLLAHLEKLEAEGAAMRVGERWRLATR